MLSEITLASLAIILATKPTPHAVDVYSGLTPEDRATVEQLVDEQDLIPPSLESLIAAQKELLRLAPQPTSETSSTALMSAPQPTSETSSTALMAAPQPTSETSTQPMLVKNPEEI